MIDIKELIKSKIKEHMEIIAQVQPEVLKLQKDMAEDQNRQQNLNKYVGIVAFTRKLDFHKACAACLNDLLQSIETP